MVAVRAPVAVAAAERVAAVADETAVRVAPAGMPVAVIGCPTSNVVEKVPAPAVTAVDPEVVVTVTVRGTANPPRSNCSSPWTTVPESNAGVVAFAAGSICTWTADGVAESQRSTGSATETAPAEGCRVVGAAGANAYVKSSTGFPVAAANPFR